MSGWPAPVILLPMTRHFRWELWHIGMGIIAVPPRRHRRGSHSFCGHHRRAKALRYPAFIKANQDGMGLGHFVEDTQLCFRLFCFVSAAVFSPLINVKDFLKGVI